MSAELFSQDAAFQGVGAVEQQGHRAVGSVRDDDLADVGDLVVVGGGIDGAFVAVEDLEGISASLGSSAPRQLRGWNAATGVTVSSCAVSGRTGPPAERL